jgi:hypothetical protein
MLSSDLPVRQSEGARRSLLSKLRRTYRCLKTGDQLYFN